MEHKNEINFCVTLIRKVLLCFHLHSFQKCNVSFRNQLLTVLVGLLTSLTVKMTLVELICISFSGEPNYSEGCQKKFPTLCAGFSLWSPHFQKRADTTGCPYYCAEGSLQIKSLVPGQP